MPEPTTLTPASNRFSIRKLFGLVAAIAIGLLPTALFEWQGIISTICLTVAGVLFVAGKRWLAMAMAVILLLGQIFYPAMDGARETILRTECENNIRRLTIAIHDYESKHGQIPPPFSTDIDGAALHSWRVLLLPFVGEQELYYQIDTSKPWDDPVNIPFHNQMPDIYCCAAIKYHSKWGSTGNTTSYVVVVGQNTAWRTDFPPTLAQISNADGTSRTIAVVESENHRIPWMSYGDPDVTTFLNTLDFSQPHNGLLNFSVFDSSTQVLSSNLELERISEMLIMDDGK